MKRVRSLSVLVCLASVPTAWAGGDLGTGFTYQGQLRDNGAPVNGEVDMIFRLFNLPLAGGQTGPTLTFDDVAGDRIMVDNGLFDVTLDFGVEVFGFEDRWLEISVRTPPGVGGYDVLAPRQRVSPTPVALQTRGMFVTDEQFVGIGTLNPDVRLHLTSGTDVAPAGGGFLQIGNSNSTNIAVDSNEIMARNNGAVATLALNADGGNVTMFQSGAGMVGIGTPTPATLLHLASAASPTLRWQDTSAGGKTFHIGISSADDSLRFAESGVADRMTIAADGNIGISTSSPDAKLQIEGGTDTAPASGGYFVIGSTTGINLSMDNNEIMARNNGAVATLFLNTDGGDVRIGGNLGINGAPVTDVDVHGTTTFSRIRAASVNADTWVQFWSGHTNGTNDPAIIWSDEVVGDALRFGTGSVGGGSFTEHMRISGAGNVGMGTTAPAVALHVDGGTDAELTDGSGYLLIGDQNGENMVLDANEIMARNNAAVAGLFLNNEGGDIRLGSGTLDNGDVGIGRDPAANDLEVSGTASKTAAGDWASNSDARIKTDVRTVRDALDKINRVRLVEFRYTDEYRAKNPSLEDRDYLNVIAQEFREVFPDWVKGSGEFLADGEEILQVDPYPITIYAAAAVQELSRIVETQKDEAAHVQRRLAAVEIVQRENVELRTQLADLAKRLKEMETRVARAESGETLAQGTAAATDTTTGTR